MTSSSAPASSANLGPGFDVIGLALDIRCRVTVERSDEWSVVSAGEPAGETTRAMMLGVAGSSGPFSVTIESEIPQAKGLGSSAALLTAAAAAMGQTDDRRRIFETAAPVEGHPENVAAACYGGLVAVGADGEVHRLSIHPSLEVLVALPDEPLSTEAAREALVGDVERDVVRRTVARTAALVEGLRSADFAMLRAAGGDEIHELPRKPVSPVTAALVEAARDAGGFHSAWSGAGSGAIAVVDESSAEQVREAFAGVLGDRGVVIEPGIDRLGVILA